jgi:hypothetical protein
MKRKNYLQVSWTADDEILRCNHVALNSEEIEILYEQQPEGFYTHLILTKNVLKALRKKPQEGLE